MTEAPKPGHHFLQVLAMTVLDDTSIQCDVVLPDGKVIPCVRILLDLPDLVEAIDNYCASIPNEDKSPEHPPTLF